MYKTVNGIGEGEIEEKKSRFICRIKHVEKEEEALEYLAAIRKERWDARHNCYAYVIGPNNELTRCSDDGEPAGTAGRPMLDVILKEGLHDVIVVVTRYFGGTLLGTGGLVRAYQGATLEGIAGSDIFEVKTGYIMSVKTDYNSVGKLQYLIARDNIFTMDTEYTDSVVFSLVLEEDQAEAFKNTIIEATAAKAEVSLSDPLQYAILDGELKLF